MLLKKMMNYLKKCLRHVEEGFGSIKLNNDKIESFKNTFKNDIAEIKLKMKETGVADIQQSLSKDMVLKFQNFTDKLNNRFTEEVETFKKVHDDINKNIQNAERSMNVHFLLHKNDSDKVIKLNKEVDEIKSNLQQAESRLMKEVESIFD